MGLLYGYKVNPYPTKKTLPYRMYEKTPRKRKNPAAEMLLQRDKANPMS